MIALFVATVLSSVAFAQPGGFAFTFKNMTGTQDSQTVGYREAPKTKGRDWSLTISAGSGDTAISSKNKLGLRPRKGLANNDGELGPYKVYTAPCTNLARTYSTDVAVGPNNPVMLRGKKDDSSTSSHNLSVSGSFRP